MSGSQLTKLSALPVSQILRWKALICFIFLTPAISAQLCTGSLGDPAVNITFGAGANPGAPLSAATTKYQYTSDPCPVNGFYTIANSGVDCMYGWHVLTGDHTGNPNGYFMLVDASFEPSDFYLDTVKNLCPNTTYEFAAWVINMKYVTMGIRPNINFTVETEAGAIIRQVNTGDIPVEPTVKWKQYGFYFTTPSNASRIVLRMTNTAPGGDGNDLALDDITFRPCGPVITSGIQGYSVDTVKVCEGDRGLYTFTGEASSAYLNPSYQWQVSTDSGAVWTDIPGASFDTYVRQPSRAGVYWYRVAVTDQLYSANIACRISSNSLVVIVQAKPLVNAGFDRVVFRGDTIHLSGSATGENVKLYWSPGTYLSDINSQEPVALPDREIDYILSAESGLGCRSVDTVSIKVVENIFVPNAFTPNGDGRNDYWQIPFLDPLLGSSVTVYNRYGELIYRAEGIAVNWDGKWKGEAQPSGTYVYVVRFKKGRKAMKGTILLIR